MFDVNSACTPLPKLKLSPLHEERKDKHERQARMFRAPISPSKLSKVIYQPCPDRQSCSFHKPYVKHCYLCSWCCPLYIQQLCLAPQGWFSFSQFKGVSWIHIQVTENFIISLFPYLPHYPCERVILHHEFIFIIIKMRIRRCRCRF